MALEKIRQVEKGAASVVVDGSPAIGSEMRDRGTRGQTPVANMRGLMGSIIYWAAVLLVLFGIISAAMSLALFEGDERLWGTVRWVAFTIAAFVVGRIARIALSR